MLANRCRTGRLIRRCPRSPWFTLPTRHGALPVGVVAGARACGARVFRWRWRRSRRAARIRAGWSAECTPPTPSARFSARWRFSMMLIPVDRHAEFATADHRAGGHLQPCRADTGALVFAGHVSPAPENPRSLAAICRARRRDAGWPAGWLPVCRRCRGASWRLAVISRLGSISWQPGIVDASSVPTEPGSPDRYCLYVGEGMNVSVAVTQTRNG